MTSEQIRQSKIYSYFHGKNTGFQQFLAAIGIFLILLSGVFVTARVEERNDLREELQRLSTDKDKAENIYYDIYNNYRNDLDVGAYQESVSHDAEYDEEADEYNKALADYNRVKSAYDEVNKELQDFSNPKDSIFVKLFKILGYLTILAAAVWVIIKRITFNHEGEELVDEELQRKTVEAHAKAMEKLNIVSEQIDRVDPVILNGVATFNQTGGLVDVKFKGFFGKIIRFIYTYGIFFLTAISSYALIFIGNKVVSFLPFILYFILVAGLAGFVGYKVFIKYQKNSYVSPKKIDKLNDFDPKYIEVLGSDDKVRVSLPSIIVYMFSDEQLYVYHQYFDIVTGHIFYEGTTEYFYEDIVGVTSDQKTKKLFKRYGFLNLRRRRINYLNEGINVVTKGNIHTQNYIVSMGNSLLDTQFRGMRNLIRQKKEEK